MRRRRLVGISPEPRTKAVRKRDEWSNVPVSVKALLAVGRTASRCEPLISHAEIDLLVDRYGSALPDAEFSLSRTVRLDLIATKILSDDRARRAKQARRDFGVFHFDTTYLSAYQAYTRSSREKPWPDLDVLAVHVRALHRRNSNVIDPWWGWRSPIPRRDGHGHFDRFLDQVARYA